MRLLRETGLSVFGAVLLEAFRDTTRDTEKTSPNAPCLTLRHFVTGAIKSTTKKTSAEEREHQNQVEAQGD